MHNKFVMGCELISLIFQVIASMTVGKDVSALFPDVANCMQTDNLELKKLVYLYLVIVLDGKRIIIF